MTNLGGIRDKWDSSDSIINQGLKITIKLSYLITYMCQNIGVHDICGQIPRSIYQTYLLPFTNFSKLILI